jgi:hypothetical protein
MLVIELLLLISYLWVMAFFCVHTFSFLHEAHYLQVNFILTGNPLKFQQEIVFINIILGYIALTILYYTLYVLYH